MKVTVEGFTQQGITIADTDVTLKSTVGLMGAFTKFYNEVNAWCFDYGVEADMIKSSSDGEHDISIWRISDEAQRLAFILRWS